MNNTLTISIDHIAKDGAGETDVSGTSLRVHGMLPGEQGIVEVHKKHGMLHGVLKELIIASPSRKNPEELHYLSCSPWQVMEYPLQVDLKQKMISELFSYYADAPKAGFETAEQFFGYRTKIEFSFCDRDGEFPLPLSLAFHERGGGSRRLALPEGCALASESMNRVALEICRILREKGYTASDLKTLVIRESKAEGQILAILFAKKETIEEFDVSHIEGLSGFLVYHSTKKSPASVPTKGLWGLGDENLTEIIDGISIRYSWDSFFQNNIPVFEKAVGIIKKHIKPKSSILELYSGAGTIGLMLAKDALCVKGVEIVSGAVESANTNAHINGITNYSAVCLPAEAIDVSLLKGNDVLVLDPPRSGLHPKLIRTIKEALPAQIVYLSCNPETQARDYSELAELYEISAIYGFDFYPQTPHSESLITLNLRAG